MRKTRSRNPRGARARQRRLSSLEWYSGYGQSACPGGSTRESDSIGTRTPGALNCRSSLPMTRAERPVQPCGSCCRSARAKQRSISVSAAKRAAARADGQAEHLQEQASLDRGIRSSCWLSHATEPMVSGTIRRR